MLRIDGEIHVASRAVLHGIGEETTSALEVYHTGNPDHAGMSVERLRRQVAPRIAAPLFRTILLYLRESGGIVVDGAWVHLPSHTITLTPKDEALWSGILPLLSGQERFRPPRVRDIATVMDLDETFVRALLRRLQRAARVDEIAHDHFFLRTTTAEMASIARQIAESHDDGWFPARAFRDQIISGRKVAIQILEFLDRHGVTHRRGDLRRLNPPRQDLFTGTAGENPDVFGGPSRSHPDLESTSG